jgi:DNA-binding MarR family transcriptional regulator
MAVSSYYGYRSFGYRSISRVAGASEPERMPIGQLLGNLLRLFRAELAKRGAGAAEVEGIRPAHLQIFGTIKADGTRLTDLAAWSDLSLSAAAELVDDLERQGYVERRPDPSDGRAKLVCLTDRGWTAMRAGRAAIAAIEADWAAAIGPTEFTTLAAGLQALLDHLEPEVRKGYATPP